MEALYYTGRLVSGLEFETDMRWFVEVSRVGENGVADEYCVEAKQWQAALQEARKLRGDTGALSKFSIELLDRGYRAVDPALKLRYLINEAPPDSTLTDSEEAAKKNDARNEAASKHRSTESLAPSAYATSLAPTPFTTSLAPPGTSGSSLVPRPTSHAAPRPNSVTPPRVTPVEATRMSEPARVSEAARVSQLVVPHDPVPRAPLVPGNLGLPPQPFAPRVPLFELVRQRAEEPRPDSPITYREFAYAVEPGRTRAEIEALLQDRYQATRAAIEDRPPGKFVQLAVFDHVFKRRPERPPLATFAWKDWRGEPVLAFPGFGEEPMGPLSRVPPAPESMPPPSNGVAASALPHARSLAALLPPPSSAPASTEAAKGPISIVPMAPVVITSAPPPPASVAPPPAPVPAAAVEAEAPIAEAAPATAIDAEIPIEEAAPARALEATAPVEEAASAPASDLEIPIEDGAPAPASDLEIPIEDGAPAPAFAAISADQAAPAPVAAAISIEAAPAPAFAAIPGEPAAAAPPLEAPVSITEGGRAPLVESPIPSEPATVAQGFELTFESQPGGQPLSAPAASSPAASERASRPRIASESRRRAGEDLIGELFEIMHELHFARDVAEGSQFVLSVLDELLPCEGVLIHVFDINTGHFVVVRAKGPNDTAVLLQRMSDQDPLVRSVMRSSHALSVKNAASDPRFTGSRWQALGVVPRAALCGGVQLSGRYLGLIEVANPHGDVPFHQSELNALDYICEQFAAFLSKKPIVLSADVVLSRV